MRGLASVPRIRVSDPGSVTQAALADTAIRAIGTRLGATAILRGTIRHADDGIHVATQLVQAIDGRELWSGTYDWRAGDGGRSPVTFAQQWSRGSTSPARRNARSSAPRPIPSRTICISADNSRSSAAHRRASRKRPSTSARLSAATRRSLVPMPVWPTFIWRRRSPHRAERFRRAQPLVAKALAQDSMLSAAHRAAGWIAMWYDHDWQTAERHLRRAVALDSSDIWAYHALAAYLGAVGLHDEGLAVSRATTMVDPVTAISATHLGHHLFARGRYEESIAVLEHALDVDTTWKRAYATSAGAIWLLAIRRRNPHAPADWVRVRRVPIHRQSSPTGWASRAHTAEARTMVNGFEARSRGGYVRPLDLVAAHLGLGDTARALDWAEKIPDDRGSMSFLLGRSDVRRNSRDAALRARPRAHGTWRRSATKESDGRDMRRRTASSDPRHVSSVGIRLWYDSKHLAYRRASCLLFET